MTKEDNFFNLNNEVVFRGKDYHAWKFRLNSILEAKSVEHVLTEKCPTDEEKKKAWDKCEKTARAIIIQLLSNDQLSIIQGTKTSKEIIEKLDGMYLEKGMFGKYYLKKQVLNMKMKPDENLKTHLVKFENLIRTMQTGSEEIKEDDKICYLFMSLPDKYENYIESLEGASETGKMTYDYVVRKLKNFNEKKNAGKEENGENSAVFLTNSQSNQGRGQNRGRGRSFHGVRGSNNFQNRNFSNGAENSNFPNGAENSNNFPRNQNNFNSRGRSNFRGRGQNQSVQCHNCGKFGHFKSECKTDKQCFNCKKFGHLKSECYFLDRNSNAGGSSQNQSQNKREEVLFYSNTEVEEPMALTSSSSSNKIKFYLDSGCSEHMVNDDKYFSSMTVLQSPININVAKDKQQLSASKLEDNGFTIVFANKRALIKKFDKIYCTAERKGRMYELIFETYLPDIIQANVTDAVAIDIHKKFAHLNFDSLKELFEK
ncbi:unnamed protein product, partial [Allacma fusca]